MANLDGMAHTSMQTPIGEGTLEPDQKPGLLMSTDTVFVSTNPTNTPLEPDQKPGLLKSLDHDSTTMVRETVAGNACVSATRWQRVSTVSVPVLRCTPGGPHLPPYPLPLPVGERKGERAAA
jgi:hypothetical protein